MAMKRYPGKIFNIPFYESRTDVYRVKLRIKKSDLMDPTVSNGADMASEDIDDILHRAAKQFITYFFPEFYVYLYDHEAFAQLENADEDVAQKLLEDVTDRIRIEGVGNMANPAKLLVVCRLPFFIDDRRQELFDAEQLPSFEDTLSYFNDQQQIDSFETMATFNVTDLGKTNKSLNAALKSYDTQMKKLPSPPPIAVDFSSLMGGTQSILNRMVTLLSRQLNVGKPSYDFIDSYWDKTRIPETSRRRRSTAPSSDRPY